jgi:tetratricopeptide (TPR) repeat protein
LQARNDEVNGLLTEAVSLWKAKRADESVEKFQQVIRLAPDYAEAHFSLGVVYEAQGRYIDALNCYKRAAELEPNKKDYRQAVATLDKKAQAMQEDNGKKAELRALADDAAGAYRRGEYISALDLYKQLDDKAQAAKQLEINLKRDEDERLSAERAWTQQNQNGNQSNQQRNQQRNQQQQSTGGGALGAGAGPPSSTFGILIKPNKEGVLVTTIGIGSRASRCGLQRGDVIRAVDGIVIQAPDQFQQIFAGKQPNQSVQLLIQRKDQIVQIIL